VPFILAASGESAVRKFHRRGEQLRWALDHGVLAQAITRLEACPPDQWGTFDSARWGMSFYPTDDEGDDAD
jgi:hypothetical protein